MLSNRNIKKKQHMDAHKLTFQIELYKSILEGILTSQRRAMLADKDANTKACQTQLEALTRTLQDQMQSKQGELDAVQTERDSCLRDKESCVSDHKKTLDELQTCKSTNNALEGLQEECNTQLDACNQSGLEHQETISGLRKDLSARVKRIEELESETKIASNKLQALDGCVEERDNLVKARAAAAEEARAHEERHNMLQTEIAEKAEKLRALQAQSSKDDKKIQDQEKTLEDLKSQITDCAKDKEASDLKLAEAEYRLKKQRIQDDALLVGKHYGLSSRGQETRGVQSMFNSTHLSEMLKRWHEPSYTRLHEGMFIDADQTLADLRKNEKLSDVRTVYDDIIRKNSRLFTPGSQNNANKISLRKLAMFMYLTRELVESQR